MLVTFHAWFIVSKLYVYNYDMKSRLLNWDFLSFVSDMANEAFVCNHDCSNIKLQVVPNKITTAYLELRSMIEDYVCDLYVVFEYTFHDQYQKF